MKKAAVIAFIGSLGVAPVVLAQSAQDKVDSIEKTKTEQLQQPIDKNKDDVKKKVSPVDETKSNRGTMDDVGKQRGTPLDPSIPSDTKVPSEGLPVPDSVPR